MGPSWVRPRQMGETVRLCHCSLANDPINITVWQSPRCMAQLSRFLKAHRLRDVINYAICNYNHYCTADQLPPLDAPSRHSAVASLPIARCVLCRACPPAAMDHENVAPRRSLAPSHAPSRSPHNVLREVNIYIAAAQPAGKHPAPLEDSCDSDSSVVISSSDSEADEAGEAGAASSPALALQQQQQQPSPAAAGSPAGASCSPAMFSAASSWAPSSPGSGAAGAACATPRTSPSPSSAARPPGRLLLFSATPQQQLQGTPAAAAAPPSTSLARRQVGCGRMSLPRQLLRAARGDMLSSWQRPQRALDPRSIEAGRCV
jgi:hypothetical protein